MNTATIQQIIDHWHLGRVQRFKEEPGHFRVRTDQGVFVLVELSRSQWSGDAEGEVARSLPSIAEAARVTDPLFCHVAGYHYCAFNILKPRLRAKTKCLAVVRRAQEKDYAAVEEMTRALHEADHAGMPKLYKPKPKRVLWRGTFLNIIENNRYEAYFVAVLDSQIVGFLYISTNLQDEDEVVTRLKDAEVGSLYVKPEARRQGVATALLTKAEDWGRRHHTDRLTVLTYPYSQEAMALYTKYQMKTSSIKLAKWLK